MGYSRAIVGGEWMPVVEIGDDFVIVERKSKGQPAGDNAPGIGGQDKDNSPGLGSDRLRFTGVRMTAGSIETINSGHRLPPYGIHFTDEQKVRIQELVDGGDIAGAQRAILDVLEQHSISYYQSQGVLQVDEEITSIIARRLRGED